MYGLVRRSGPGQLAVDFVEPVSEARSLDAMKLAENTACLSNPDEESWRS